MPTQLDHPPFPLFILTNPSRLCHNRAMNAAASITSDPAAQPDLTRAWARASATLNAFAALVAFAIRLVHSRNRRGVMRCLALLKLLWRRSNSAVTQHLARLRQGRLPSGQDSANASAATSRDAPRVHSDSPSGPLTQFIAEVDRRKAPASRIEAPRFEAPPEHHRPVCFPAEEHAGHHPPPPASSVECRAPAAEPCSASRTAFRQTDTVPAKRWPVLMPPAPEVAATAPR